MSKVPVTIDVERYVCTELEELRKMHECRDFSGMLASIERIQRHVNAMEEALHINKWKDLFASSGIWNFKDAEKFMKEQKEKE